MSFNNNQENYTYSPETLSTPQNNNIPTDNYNQNLPNQELENNNNSVVYTPYYVPDEIKGWNWGAFFWNWVWLVPVNTTLAIIMCFANMVTCGLSTLILAFYLGIKGNEMAWEKRQYKSIEEFKEEQKKWTISGLLCIFLPFVIGVITFISIFMIYFGMFMSFMNSMGH